VVGLGNPGARYRGSRHNIGAVVVEAFARSSGFAAFTARFGGRYAAGRSAGQRVAVLLPETFMNRSGEAVGAALADPGLEWAPSDLLVVADDLDLPLGRLRLRPAGSSGGQRGLESVIEALGHSDFSRLRFGIGRPPHGHDPVAYVLEDFAPDERERVDEAVQRASSAVESVIAEGVDVAMGRFNRPLEEPS
jgi:PTH1 family peptidyl-tRNA hydrolase